MTTNLSGSLGTFGLDEVLSMLGMGGRSGRMEVTSAQGVGEIHMVDGHVSAASSDRGRAVLLRQLVGSADVSADDLLRALQQPEPARALVDSGTVERGFAHGIAVDQVVDALGEMLTWADGEFAVWVGAEHEGDIGVRLPVAEAVDRARGRADEWGRVRAALPEEGAVLALAPAVGDTTSLGREDWSVLVRVDGRRTLAEVVAAAGCAPLVASDRIVDLMGRGLVRVRSVQEEQPDDVAMLLDQHEAGDGQVQVEAVVEVGVAAEPLGMSDLLLDEEDDPFDASDHARVDAAAAVAIESGDSAEALGVGDPAESVLESGEQPTWEHVGFATEAGEEAVLLSEDADEDIAADVVDEDPVEDSVHDVIEVAVEPVPVLTDPEPVVDYSFPIAVEHDMTGPEPGTDPVGVATDPAAAPVAPALEWSPWAQALGLGAPAPEGELVGDPLAGPGIAEMIAEAHGLADTEYVPVPLAPVAQGSAEAPAVPEPGAVPEAQPMLEAEALLPEPRPAMEDAQPVAEAQAVAEERAEGTGQPAQAEEVPALAPEAATPDPLAGGLLAQLMTGVRGL